MRNGNGKHTGRAAFTLVELLVVISLMLVLAGIMVMFWPSLNESQRSAEGAASLQGWLRIAKQRALRDQAPRGIRLYVSTLNGVSNVVKEAQYIEQPDDIRGGTVSITGNTATFNGINLSGGQTDPNLWLVQVYDHVDVSTTGKVHQISSASGSGNGPYTLNLASGVDTATTSCRIIRGPRVSSDEKLEMPKDIAIDLNTNSANGNVSPVGPYTAGYVDILFAPSGNVIGDLAGTDIVYLWVRDVVQYPNVAQQFDGEPTIIGVYVRSGLVAAYPPNQSGDPYQFVKDGGTTGP